ncbi:MAG: mono/diheme cytochrome c family protein [Sneathiella sp.]
MILEDPVKKVIVVGVLGVIVAALAAYYFYSDENMPAASGGRGPAIVEVTLPDHFTPGAMAGKTLYDKNCVSCHGTNAAGQDGVAPPLIHKIYEPGHHGDGAFFRAVAQGVRAHHWPFGNMPAIEGLNQTEVALIIRYVREIQQASGIR